MEKINRIYQYIIKYWKVVLLVFCALLIINNFRSCNNNSDLNNKLKQEKMQNEQNIHSLNDTITIYKNKKGDVSYKKTIGDMSEDQLKEFNPDLYSLLKSEGGKVTTIIKTIYIYRDTGSTKNTLTKLAKDEYSLSFMYNSNDSIVSVDGKSFFNARINDDKTLNIKPGNTEFDNIKIKFSLTTGIKDDNGIPRIFVTPSSNKIIVSDISGSDISDYVKSIKTKRKNYSVNMSFGYGIIFGGNNQLLYGPSVQLGIGYNIINF